MKNTSIIRIGLFMALTLCACVDDAIIQVSDEPRVEEGIPMTASFSFQVEKPVIETRAAASVTAENTVRNLYIFAFNSDGTLDSKKLYNNQNSEEWETTNQKQEEGDRNTTGTVTNFPMTSGNDKTFYAVANVGYSGVTEEMFNDITTREQLLGKTSHLLQDGNIQRTYFVMTGQLGQSSGNGTMDYTYNVAAGQNNLQGTLYLKRTDARITFQVTASNTNHYENFSFVPKNYRVFNIPQASYLFEQENDAEGTYSNLPTTLNFDTQKIGEGVTSTFDFYLQENRQPYQRQITEGTKAEYEENADATLFAMREKREMNKPDNLEGRAFIFAPEHGTYVEIQGVLSYQKQNNEGNTEFISADVCYTIHLGNTGGTNDVNNVEKVNNYETKRNTHYTYRVTITDVNSIIVEVDDDSEERPGAEGDVVVAGGEVVELDAHFDRYRFILWRDDLAAVTDEDMLTWAVSTPFENAMRIPGGPNESMPKDYKWITFAINKEYNENINNANREFYVKYPGDDIYDGYGNGTPTETGTYKTPHWNGYYIPSENRGQIALRDVEQLLNFLHDKAVNNTDSDLFEYFQNVNGRSGYGVAVTAFIDEFVYIKDPTDPTDTSTPENPTPEGLRLWKQVVNGSDRLLHICRGVGNKSEDGASSVIRSVLSFRQHPIYTIYDTSSDVTTAWGTESIMETDPLAASFNHNHRETYENTRDNGRQNQMNFVIDTEKEWNEIISQNDRYGLNSSYYGTNYNTIWHACMLRNRDINGDNIIDAREVRWYLAAIDQLSDLWTGDASINESARAYPNEEYGKRYHIASSTYYWKNTNNPSSLNPTVLWAEEGGSIGDYNYSHVYGNPTGDNYAYRCVRNLGISLENATQVPDDYIQWDASTRTVDLSRLGYASKRSAYDGGNELAEHNEREESNKPYVKFQVHNGQNFYRSRGQNVNYSWNQFNARLYPDSWWVEAESPCPAGYRVPNQRELGIMITIPDLQEELDAQSRTITNTAFSMNGEGLYEDGDRPGFIYRGDEGTFLLDTDTYNPNRDTSTTDNKGGTRCVRDVTN